ncbi:hypothetical protein BZL41_24890 [Pseudomonas sp. PIC25]|uniref:tellurite resistance TerB family protein n=1 Tax=Pseudomonas sp. PIC25 TaxID=1958773 RepID=UPI000BAB88F7|nr:tellurite resistance TerB family protein [Pseudomonas sp. PIC25]PAU52815.1 hypothetical protein BZL41_24890 [Pseudomonas sp. PIC25]
MNTSGLLDQLLKSGQEMLQKKGGGGAPGKSGGFNADALGGLLSGAGGGALAAGALGLLMGNKRARKMGGKVITYGGLAALGVLAYKAYSNWQSQQATAPQAAPQTLDRLPAPQVEAHSEAILKALVAAAKSDGHVDARERELIEGELAKLTQDSQLQQWLDVELNKPLDPAEVARAARTPEMAAEMYLASVLIVDEEHFMERAYLDELARQLKLDPALKAELEAQVKQAQAGV